MNVRVLVLFVTTLLLTACGLPLTQDSQNKNPEVTHLKQVVAQLSTGDADLLKQELSSDLVGELNNDLLKQMIDIFPSSQPTSVDLVNYSWMQKNNFSGESETNTSIAMQYGYSGNKWLLVDALLENKNNIFVIKGFHINVLSESLQETNQFTLVGKGILHYVFLLCSVGAFLLSIYAFIACLRTPKFKRKWLWGIFTLLGAGFLTINWTTGAVGFQLLHFSLFSAGFSKFGFLGAWHLSFGLPIGAIIFLRKRADMRIAQQTNG